MQNVVVDHALFSWTLPEHVLEQQKVRVPYDQATVAIRGDTEEVHAFDETAVGDVHWGFAGVLGADMGG